MKLLMNDIVRSESALTALGNTNGLSSIVAYRIFKNIKALHEEITLYNETRKKLCFAYANKDDKGNPIIKNNSYDIPKDKKEQFDNEFQELINMEVDIDIKKIKLEDIDKAGLSPFQIESIEFMLDFKK